MYIIKIIKKNPDIHYDKCFNCNLEEAIKIRNKILKNNNVLLKKKENKNKNILIEKYIYKLPLINTGYLLEVEITTIQKHLKHYRKLENKEK